MVQFNVRDLYSDKEKELLEFVISENTEGVERCLDNGANIEYTYSYEVGFTPFLVAADRGAIHSAEILMQRGANVSAVATCAYQNTYKFTAIHLAAINGHTDMVKWLVENTSLTLDSKGGKSGMVTPVLLAAHYGQIDVLKYCIEKLGNDAFEKVGAGHDNTALNFAVKGNKYETVDFLLSENVFSPQAMAVAIDSAKKFANISKLLAEHRQKLRIRSSEIDYTRQISNEMWVASLVRQTAPGTNTFHVFIVIEGMENGNAKIYFMDFTAGNPKNLMTPGRHRGKIRFCEKTAKVNESLICSCHLKLMEIDPRKELAHFTFSIQNELAKILIRTVSAASSAKEHPIYNVFGKDSLSAYSSAVSFSTTDRDRHNCSTWAYYQLKSLGKNIPTLPHENDHLAWIISIPSVTLPSKTLTTNKDLKFAALGFMLALFCAAVYSYIK